MAKSTMKDVAREANVSVATVSNVLNNISNKTTDETKARVMRAVKALNYRMDMTARSLSIGKSNLIGVFFPESRDFNETSSVLKDNPFYSEILSGIEYQARVMGYDVLVNCVRTSDHVVELSHKRTLDGIAIIGVYDSTFWERIKETQIPRLLIDSYEELAEDVGNVGIDDEMGAYLAAKHLIQLGHRRIGFVTYQLGERDVNRMRYNGFLKALWEADILEEECPIILCDVSFDGGQKVGQLLLKNYQEITAVFTIADIVALGIMKIWTQYGKKIPEDLSIVGFDDLQVCQYTSPALTTIRQDVYQKGREVARVLIEKVKGQTKNVSISLPIELVVRETTCKCKGGK